MSQIYAENSGGAALDTIQAISSATSTAASAWGSTIPAAFTAAGQTLTLPAIAATDIGKTITVQNAGTNSFSLAIATGTITSNVGLSITAGVTFIVKAVSMTSAIVISPVNTIGSVAIVSFSRPYDTTNYVTAVPNGGRFPLNAAQRQNISGITFDDPNDRLTIQTAGTYTAEFNAAFISGTSGWNAQLSIRKNGTTILSSDLAAGVVNVADKVTILWSGLLAVGDIIDIQWSGVTNQDCKSYDFVLEQVVPVPVVSSGSNPTVTEILTSQTFTRDVSAKYLRVQGVGGSGGGGYAFGQAGANTVYVGMGSGAGGYIDFLISAADFGASQVITIGAAGAVQGAGGNTTIGTLATANGSPAGGGTYANCDASLTSCSVAPSAAPAGFTLTAVCKDLGSRAGELPTYAHASIQANTTSSIVTSRGGNSPFGMGAAAARGANGRTAGNANYNAISPAANTGAGASGDCTYSTNGTAGIATTAATGSAGRARITQYF